ncbi:MAG TPA: hypothetical protein VFE04_10020 [Puia sp.]|nr:hypothetical protein [Puia sp.]
MKNMIKKTPLYLFMVFVMFSACKPEIYSFSANPKIITDQDSVHLKWDIRGKPELSFHQRKIPYSGGDSLQQLQFILVAVKGSSRTSSSVVELNVLPQLYRDVFFLPVNGRHGDTLVADGIRDSLYNDFRIESMTSLNGRKIWVSHAGYQTMLYDSVTKSKTFRGVDYSGAWKFESMLTPDEKVNPKHIPEQFAIAVFIKPKKP